MLFIWNHREDKLNNFLENLNNFKSSLKFRYGTSKEDLNLLDLNVSIRESLLVTD